jgi:Skp family chaperone for outer membrane proteins
MDGRHDLEALDKDINTLRRQVEIIQDSSLRKENSIFILKTSLTYLCLIFIPLILAYKQMFSWMTLTYIVIAITILFAIIIYYNLRSVMSRDPMRFSVRTFGDTMAPSIRPKKCVSRLAKVLTPQEREINTKKAELDRINQTLNELNEKKTELETKKREFDYQEQQLAQKFTQRYPDDILDKEIDRNAALRSSFRI